MRDKQTFLYLFLILALALMLMPFFTTFNDLLTRLVMSVKGYRFIQEFVVPSEVKMIALLLKGLGFETAATPSYVVIENKESPFLLEIVWNCIGWQSLLFFVLTTWVGLQGDSFTLISKLKAFWIGMLGTFLVNIFRITLVVLIAYYTTQRTALLFHDYGSTLMLIVWLFFFWWFVYVYVLEPPDKKRA